MKLNRVILREIAFQISHGNPLWGMLLGNEYLRENDHLRKAIITRFAGRMLNVEQQTLSAPTQLLIKRLIGGATAIQLSDELMCIVGARTVLSPKHLPMHPKIFARSEAHDLPIRHRRTTPKRFRGARETPPLARRCPA